MPKVLITGSAGFVASHIIPLLVPNFEVIGVSRSQGNSNDNFKSYQSDITDFDSINQLITQIKPEYILHLAAHARTHGIQTQDIFNTNFFGTANLYQAILSQTNYKPKVVYISSSEVYGNTNNPGNIDESALLNPTNLYGVSKVSADRLSYQVALAHKLDLIILRPFPHTGPGQPPGFFVPDVASQIAQIEKTSQPGTVQVGNLQAIRDYLDVRDVAQAYYSALTTDLPSGESYNISSNQGISIQTMFDQLASFSQTPISPSQDHTRVRAQEIPVHIGNSDKFRAATNWSPQIPINQTLEDTLNYYRNL